MRDGYLICTALADCCIHADFDSEGTQEHVFYAINGNNHIQLRIYDTNDKPFVFWKDLGPYQNVQGHLGITPAKAAGLDSLFLNTPDDETSSTEHKTFFTHHPGFGIQEALLTRIWGFEQRKTPNFYQAGKFTLSITAPKTSPRKRIPHHA